MEILEIARAYIAAIVAVRTIVEEEHVVEGDACARLQRPKVLHLVRGVDLQQSRGYGLLKSSLAWFCGMLFSNGWCVCICVCSDKPTRAGWMTHTCQVLHALVLVKRCIVCRMTCACRTSAKLMTSFIFTPGSTSRSERHCLAHDPSVVEDAVNRAASCSCQHSCNTRGSYSESRNSGDNLCTCCDLCVFEFRLVAQFLQRQCCTTKQLHAI